MKRIIIALLTLASLLLADYDRHETHEYHLPKDLRHLDLTPEQHQKVKKVLQHYRDAHIKLRQAQHETAEKSKRLFMREKFDKAHYIALSLEHKKAAAELDAEMLDAVHSLLTPAQRDRFVHYLDEWVEQ